jgi:hypothetical protein
VSDYRVDEVDVEQWVVVRDGDPIATYASESEAEDARRQMQTQEGHIWQEGGPKSV